MSANEKKKWDTAAEKDKARYEKEMEEYNKTLSNKHPATSLNKNKNEPDEASPTSVVAVGNTATFLTKQDAERALQTTAPPTAPKKQSQYVRFKALMLQEAKATGDKEIQNNITIVAKSAWNNVKKSKKMPYGNAVTELESKLERYMRLKETAVAEEEQE